MNTYYKIPLFFTCFFIFIASNAQEHKILSERNLTSDGPEGVETYELIKSVLGPSPIEAPDLYSVNHPEVKHIIEETDSIIGNHFTFLIHKDTDKDRDTDNTDRQRNEIKAYAGSDDELKAFNGESMRYHWFFQLDEGFSISKNFSHFFQLKAVGGSYSSQPVVTISGSINSNKPQFEIMHSSLTGAEDVQLKNTEWENANTGKWMEMEVLATFKDNGYLKVSIKDLQGNTILMSENESIDMWREGSDFVRPKWGIYRSLSTKQYLNDGEERARFANFTIQKVILNYTPTPPNKAYNSYPDHNAQYIDTAINLNWESGANTAYCKVFFSTTPELNESHLIDSTTESFTTIDGLEPETAYYWRVDGVNEDGITQGEVWTFATAAKPTVCDQSNLLAIDVFGASGESENLFLSNIADNDLGTAWGVAGINQWMEFDFGTEVTLNYLMIAFYEGSSKYQNFEIQTSSDASNYKTLSDYKSNGSMDDLQKVIIPETTAQYVRFVCKDTIETDQGILTEMYAFGCGGETELPTAAQLDFPENNATNIDITTKLSWYAGVGSASHRLYLGTSNELTEEHFISETSETQLEVSNLDYMQTYYWRVDEINEAGTTTGDMWSFSTTYELSSLYIQENDAGFISVAGTIENTYEGYTGEGYANPNDDSDAAITWKVKAMNNTYKLKWRYAFVNSGSTSAFLKINDKAIGLISFETTDEWSEWIVDSIDVELTEGENTISFKAISEVGLPNIDYLYIEGENVQSVTITNIEESNHELVNITPNPFQNEISLSYNSKNSEMVSIVVYNSIGKLVYKHNGIPSIVGNNTFSLPLKNIDNGIYFLNFITSRNTWSAKIIKGL